MNKNVKRIGGVLLGAVAFFLIMTTTVANTKQDSPLRMVAFAVGVVAFAGLTTIGFRWGSDTPANK